MNKLKRIGLWFKYQFDREYEEVTFTLCYKYNLTDGNSPSGNDFYTFKTTVADRPWYEPSKLLTTKQKKEISTKLIAEYRKVKGLKILRVNHDVIDTSHIVEVTYDYSIERQIYEFEDWLKYKGLDK